jgi:nitrate reductase assembly molybdenum cofactor insertion protein NarJ
MSQTAFRRAQVYQFLSQVFHYPTENWVEDLPLLRDVLAEVNLPVAWNFQLAAWDYSLESLQAEHRLAFGLTGSLCYETEFGLPHEFRQSQELADIAGFYRAFGFQMGGPVRERPDHLAVELEFMYVLALKEAYAGENGTAEQVEICQEAQAGFLQDHLGQWIGLFAQSLAHSSAVRSDRPGETALYPALAQLAVDLVHADAARLGIELKPRQLAGIHPTPLAPDLACGECLAAQDRQ